MSVMTVRGIDDKVLRALKEKAKKEGTSVNATLLRVLREALGLEKKIRTIAYDDLDHLAGTWSKKDYSEFQSKIDDFEKVDDKMWKLST